MDGIYVGMDCFATIDVCTGGMRDRASLGQ